MHKIRRTAKLTHNAAQGSAAPYNPAERQSSSSCGTGGRTTQLNRPANTTSHAAGNGRQPQ
eukprot:8650992-Heterocapsa_arctica.AAC.1